APGRLAVQEQEALLARRAVGPGAGLDVGHAQALDLDVARLPLEPRKGGETLVRRAQDASRRPTAGRDRELHDATQVPGGEARRRLRHPPAELGEIGVDLVLGRPRLEAV